MFFASDNAAPAHPAIIAALVGANQGYAAPYGQDPAMAAVGDRVRRIFDKPDAAVFLVATGTTANVLSLAPITRPWQTIYCHREAHIAVDECGAPEFYTGGAKLTLLDGAAAKFDAAGLAEAVGQTRKGDVHSVQPGPVSISNTTECGTVYTVPEIAAICAVARSAGVPVHMDGARFANALVALGATPADMTWRAGVDVLSFGGTKNGLIGVEAVIFFDPEKAWEFQLRRKRAGHLFSKHRFLSAQMLAYLTDDLWLDLARAANDAAMRLADGIAKTPGASLVHPRQANAVFASFPRRAHRRLNAAGAAYSFAPFDQSLDGPDDQPLSARLMCSWCTNDTDIGGFLACLRDEP